MDEYLTLLDETFSQALTAVKESFEQIASVIADAFEDVCEALEKLIPSLEDLNEIPWESRKSFPKPPRKMPNRFYLVDKRSQIRQYSYFRR